MMKIHKTIKEVFNLLATMIQFDRFRQNLTISIIFPDDCLCEIAFKFKTTIDVHPIKGTKIYATNDYIDFMALNSQIVHTISNLKEKYSIEIQKTGPSIFNRWMSTDTITIKLIRNDYQRIM